MKNVLPLLALLFVLGCKHDPAPTTAAEAPALPAAPPAAAPALQSLFEEVNAVKMHLFATGELEPNPADYPYVGKPVGEAELKYLSDDMQPNEIGSVYAIYRTETNGFYILRVPGKYASSDLALAKWDATSSKLVKVLDLASIQCDEGYCLQQDAWLTDLDDDRSFDLVVRSHTNDNGKISEEVFNVFTQQPPGSFTKASDNLASLAPKTSYVLK